MLQIKKNKKIKKIKKEEEKEKEKTCIITKEKHNEKNKGNWKQPLAWSTSSSF